MRALLLGVAGLAASSPAWSADPAPARPSPGPVRLWVRGGFVPGSPTFTDTRTFTEFAEQARVESRYEEDPGPGFEAELAWRFARRLALSAAVSFVRRKEGGSFSAALPHPLFFGAPRRVGGDFGGGSTRETAVHLDLAVLGTAGRIEWRAFAGPSVIGVAADLLRTVEYTHAYPYDMVTVTGTPMASTRGSAVGFNVGGGLEWPVARHLALGAQARLSHATVRLRPAAEDRVNVDAGGLQLAAGVRLDF
jgi:opacity protein-like surface antigen